MIITAQPAQTTELLRIALPTKQLQLDPQRIEDMYSMTVVNQLFVKLFRYTPDGQVRPDLVERWEVSKDKKTYTFHLKKMTFSDGTPISAQNVVHSLKRIFFLKAALSSDLSIIKGARAFAKSNKLSDLKIVAQNARTLKIETEKPTSLLIYLLAVPDVGVLKIADARHTANFGADLVSSGPYKLTSLTSDKVTLVKWRASDLDSDNPPLQIEFNLFDKINPDPVTLRKITDTSSFMTFDEGNSPLENSNEWRAVASEAANERFILMNPAKVPAVVRRWMLNQVNTEAFVKALDDKSIVPAFGFIPNCLPGHLKKSMNVKAYDLEIEKPITVKITHGANLPYAEKFRSYLKAVWSHPQLKLEFDVLPVSDYLKVLFQKTGEVVIGARGLDYPEGYSVVTYFRSNIDSNFFFVNNREIDKLIDQSASELDTEKRNKIYEAIQLKVLNEATVIPLAFGSWKKYYWSDRVKNVPAHPVGVHFIPLEMLSMAGK